MSESSPCQSCGACCSTYRVSLYWAESTADSQGRVPVELTNASGPLMRCMKGTDSAQPRCVALAGEVGHCVSCSIYAQRPSVCHQVQAGDDFCLRARQHHGLAPLPDRIAIHAA
jgi:Fe-S-cluster containining protein